MANSHFIQQKFITMFTKEKGIYVYDKKEKHPLNKLFNAKTIAYQKDLYKLELKDLCEYFGKDLSNTYPNWNADGLELALKEFEDSGMNVITKITQQETLDLSDDEKIDFAVDLHTAHTSFPHTISFAEDDLDLIKETNIEYNRLCYNSEEYKATLNYQLTKREIINIFLLFKYINIGNYYTHNYLYTK